MHDIICFLCKNEMCLKLTENTAVVKSDPISTFTQLYRYMCFQMKILHLALSGYITCPTLLYSTMRTTVQ